MANRKPSRARGAPPVRRTPSSNRRSDASGESAFITTSRSALLWLSRLPPAAIPATMVALMLAGLVGPLWLAVPALLVALGFIGWLAVLSWPVLQASGRIVRLAMACLIAATLLIRVAASM